MESSTEPQPGRRLRGERALWALLALAGAWYGWFIYRTSFVSGGKRVFCLFDDAMVSMTYARNLLEGHGLNWARQGKPVEGFTHPLWAALMIPANALPLPLRLRSLPVQLLSLGLLLLLLVLVRRLTLAYFGAGRARSWLPAAVLTAFYYSLVYWSLMGMETALQAVLVTASVLLALAAVEAQEARGGRHLALWLLATAAFLLRIDMLVPVAIIQAFVLSQGGLRREERRSWGLGLAIFLAAALGYELFRWLYFGDLLPNTYYLKLTGVPLLVRLLRGLDVLSQFARVHLAVLLPVGLGTALVLSRADPRRRHLRRRYALPAALFLGQCAYSVWVGGDAWELDINVRANRFLAFAMPLAFVLGNGLLNRLLDALGELYGLSGRLPASSDERPAGLAPAFLTASATAVALLFANGLWGSPRAEENWRNLLVTARPLHVFNHQLLYWQLAGFRQLVAPGAVVASFWAGIPAYFADYRMVDLLGYNDRRTARLPSRLELNEDNFEKYQPGHLKWDNDYVIDELRPDAFFQTWQILRPGQRLGRHGYVKIDEFWVRRDSPWVRRTNPPAGPGRPGAPVPAPDPALAGAALPRPGRPL